MFLYFVFVALETGFVAPVLNRKIFPFLDIAEPVIVVGKTVTVDAEIVRNQELSGEQDQAYHCNCKPQRVQDMPLHFHLSLYHLALERSFRFRRRSFDLLLDCLNYVDDIPAT
jgi:hypothetical protein